MEAAGLEFEENGYERAKINHIIARSGASKGSFYFHFPDKERLAKAIFESTLTLDGVQPRDVHLQVVVDTGMILTHRIVHEPALRAVLRLSMDYIAPTTYGTP
ncbi:TetR family transcriptional regulator [Streptomyces celluloflavus]|uniref:TetR family transcriptional regulator n=1 Tax=Streptomyces celluloflavus TaxID=58344 RepID=UPI0036D7B192